MEPAQLLSAGNDEAIQAYTQVENVVGVMLDSLGEPFASIEPAQLLSADNDEAIQAYTQVPPDSIEFEFEEFEFEEFEFEEFEFEVQSLANSSFGHLIPKTIV